MGEVVHLCLARGCLQPSTNNKLHPTNQNTVLESRGTGVLFPQTTHHIDRTATQCGGHVLIVQEPSEPKVCYL